MSTQMGTRGTTRDVSVRVAGLRYAVFSTRNFVFLLAVLAMNYTISRPSPVDLLYITSFLITLVHIALSAKQQVTRRTGFLSLLVGTWAASFILASLPHVSETNVIYELAAKTFAISIGVTGAFVSMSWTRRHFETFMKFYILSCVIASMLGTVGFVLRLDALTWDGRARGLIDDPNMYGSFLIPAAICCVYFLTRPQGRKLLFIGALGIVLVGIMLSFSRIAQVATFGCMFAYVVFNNRQRPQRLVLIVGTLAVGGLALFALASLVSPEFTTKFLGRFTLAEPYDLGSEGRYARYGLVLPMILQNPLGLGVLQLEKIFPEPIHNIWLSSFVNYGWVAGFTWIVLVVASVVVSILNYRRTRDDITIALLLSLVGVVMCASLHEGEHWRHLWLFFGLVWGLCTLNFGGGTSPAAAAGRHPAANRSPVRRESVTTATRPPR